MLVLGRVIGRFISISKVSWPVAGQLFPDFLFWAALMNLCCGRV